MCMWVSVSECYYEEIMGIVCLRGGDSCCVLPKPIVFFCIVLRISSFGSFLVSFCCFGVVLFLFLWRCVCVCSFSLLYKSNMVFFLVFIIFVLGYRNVCFVIFFFMCVLLCLFRFLLSFSCSLFPPKVQSCCVSVCYLLSSTNPFCQFNNFIFNLHHRVCVCVLCINYYHMKWLSICFSFFFSLCYALFRAVV